MKNKKDGITVKVSITDTNEFKVLTSFFGKILNDERIDEDVRCQYFDEVIEELEKYNPNFKTNKNENLR